MNLHINPHDATPVYRQIQRQIALAIADRELLPGQLLRAEEDLATELVISPAAVHKAYAELESAGLCDGERPGGYRVVDPGLRALADDRTALALSLLKRELLTEELETARDLQRRLLPPSEITADLWTVSARSYPAGALAGDFYEVLQHDGHVVDLIVADVAGKGLAAGLIMATARSLLPLAARESSPGAALGVLNDLLCRQLSRREFVALAWARYRPTYGTLELANAGLPDPVLLRSIDGVRSLEVTGQRLPLGVRQKSSYSTSSISLRPGDRVLLLTDGIPEAADGEGRPLGYDGLRHLLMRCCDRDEPVGGDRSTPWLDRFLDSVSRRTGSFRSDDWTALLLEAHGGRKGSTCSS